MFTNKVDVTTDGKPLPTVINVTFSDEPAIFNFRQNSNRSLNLFGGLLFSTVGEVQVKVLVSLEH